MLPFQCVRNKLLEKMPLKLGTRRNLHSFKSKMTLNVGVKALAVKLHYVSVSFVKTEAWCGIPHFHYVEGPS